jgi:hypothetical protein
MANRTAIPLDETVIYVYQKIIKVRIESESEQDLQTARDLIKETLAQHPWESPTTRMLKMWMVDYAKKIEYERRRKRYG